MVSSYEPSMKFNETLNNDDMRVVNFLHTYENFFFKFSCSISEHAD